MKVKKALFITLVVVVFAGIVVYTKPRYDAQKEYEAFSAQMYEYFKETVPKVAAHALGVAVPAYNDKGIQHARMAGTYDELRHGPYPYSDEMEVMGLDAEIACGRRITNCESVLRNGGYKLSEEYERFKSPDSYVDHCYGEVYYSSWDGFAKIIRDIARVPEVTKADDSGQQRTGYAEHCNEVCRAAARRLRDIAHLLVYSYYPVDVEGIEATYGMLYFLNWESENSDVPIETMRERFTATKAVLEAFLASKEIKEEGED